MNCKCCKTYVFTKQKKGNNMRDLLQQLASLDVLDITNARKCFSLLLPLNYLLLVSQCTKCSISFSPFLNLWKTKILAISKFLSGPMKVGDSGC